MRNQVIKRHQAYKIKSKQTLLKAKAKNFKLIKQKFLALLFLAFIGYYIFPYALIDETKLRFQKLEELSFFQLSEIEILGTNKLKHSDVIKVAGLRQSKNLLSLDLENIKQLLEQNNWVKKAEVQRVLPSKLSITVLEKRPEAIWWNNGKFYLVDIEGDIIERIPESAITGVSYLLLIGEGATVTYSDIYNLLIKKGLIKDVLSLARVGNRRWDIYLKDETLIKLPEEKVEESLDILMKLWKKGKKPLSVVDLRLIPDKIYIGNKF